MRAEYPFEYPPSPIGEIDPPSADYSPLLEYIHTFIHEEFSQEILHYDDRPNPSPSPLEVGPEARVLPAQSPQTQRVLPSERLSFLAPNLQKAGSNRPSQRNIVSLLNLHTPNFLLLTGIPLLPNNGALTHTLRNRGYKIHYQPINAPTLPDTLPEARLPDYLTHSGGGSWIAYIKYVN